MEEFPCTGPITINGRILGGLLTVIAEPRDTATVEVSPLRDDETSARTAEQTKVQMHGGTLSIKSPDADSAWIPRRSGEVRVEVHVPEGCTVRLRSGSAELSCVGQFASGSLATGSGDIHADHFTGDLSVACGSGRIEVHQVGGRLNAKQASGDLHLDGAVGDVHATSASGNLTIGEAGGSVRGNSASGAVRIGSVGRGRVRVTTASGDVAVGVRQGTGVWLDLLTGSGTTRSDLDVSRAAPRGQGPELTVQVRTASGDIEVRRVELPRAA